MTTNLAGGTPLMAVACMSCGQVEPSWRNWLSRMGKENSIHTTPDMAGAVGLLEPPSPG